MILRCVRSAIFDGTTGRRVTAVRLGQPQTRRFAWQTELMDESGDYDFTPRAGSEHLYQVFEEVAVRRVLLTDEVLNRPG